jgi:hypothetical protein
MNDFEQILVIIYIIVEIYYISDFIIIFKRIF